MPLKMRKKDSQHFHKANNSQKIRGIRFVRKFFLPLKFLVKECGQIIPY